MQKIISLFIFILSTTYSFAQQASGHIDTILTADPDNKNLIECRIRHIDGKTKSIGYLLNGKREGMWRNYTPRGVPDSYEEYKADVRDGFTVNFADNGTVENEQTYKNGSLHGLRISYLYGSTLRTKENFRNGVLDGEKITNYENGNPQEVSFYKNGNRDRKTIWYTSDNKPTIEYTYKNGLLEGPAKLYTNGVVTSEGNYKNDNEEGNGKFTRMENC
ncbi:MAG: hypothetical protein IPJ79_15955 [Bacteroidetes bacterium]|nr:hypothetical protein [Bacteroidota bacterium]